MYQQCFIDIMYKKSASLSNLFDEITKEYEIKHDISD